jgi:hypothetical protein
MGYQMASQSIAFAVLDRGVALDGKYDQPVIPAGSAKGTRMMTPVLRDQADIQRNTQRLRFDRADEYRRLRDALAARGIAPEQSVLVEYDCEDGAWYGLLVTPDCTVFEFDLGAPTRWPHVARWTEVTADTDYRGHEGLACAVALVDAEES